MVEHESHVRGVKQLMVDGFGAPPRSVFNGNSDQEDRLYTVLNVKFHRTPTAGWPPSCSTWKGWLVRAEARVPGRNPGTRTCCVPSAAKTLSVPASGSLFRVHDVGRH